MRTLLFIFIFFVACIGLLIQNAASIILGILGIIAFAILLFKLAEKWPGITLSCLFLFVIGLFIYQANIDGITQNRQPVQIYIATDHCYVWASSYDTDDQNDYGKITIPKGAIVARYDEPGVMEEIYAPMVSYYFEGHVYTYDIGTRDALNGKNTWNLEELETIKYKEFSSSNWWEIDLP